MSKHLDDLRAAAIAEWDAQRSNNPQPDPPEETDTLEPEIPEVVDPPEPEVPADEPPASDAPDEHETPPEPEAPRPAQRRTIYKKIVDLGDGNPQVFKASTKDELIEKILTAQRNASLRIKELKTENKALRQAVQPDPAKPARKLEPRTLSQDEELELVNELGTNPTSAIRKAVEALIGESIEDLRKDQHDLRTFRQKAEIQEIGQQFIQAHPEYPITPGNESKMAEYIQKNNLAWTLKNLELAFNELQDAGLVTAKAIAVPDSVQAGIVEEEEAEEQVVAPVVHTPVEPVVPAKPVSVSDAIPRRRRAVVGISSRQSVATVDQVTPREASVEEMLKLSPDERRRIVLASAGRQA